MIEVRMPKEIKDFKERFFGLTLRQLVCTGGAIIIAIPLYFYGKKYIGKEAVNWLIMLIVTPILLVGYVSYNGLPFEHFALLYLKMNVLPQKLKYEQSDLYYKLRQDLIKDKKRKKKT